ncbi:MAG TPA: zf-HC2 domain-containing protein [Arthrobacter sp.]|nr:zf-HC2 domain-containing protein [Arthrobacter sp.]
MINMRHPVSKYLEGNLSGRALRRFERHLAQCGKCRRYVEADRNIQRRLREAAGPEPRSDLAQRILARSTQMDPPAEPVRRPDTGSDGTAAWMEHRSSRVRKLVALTGSATVAAVAVLGGAYVVGSGSQINEAAGGTVFASVQSVGQSPDGRTVVANEQLNELRAAGWNCPELVGLGYDLEYAHGYHTAGQPTLQLVLSKGDSVVTIYERRKPEPTMGHSDASKSAPIINAATGHTTVEDGFSPVPLQMSDGTVATMWFRYGENWQIAFQSQQAWYTVESDIPVTEVAAAVSHVVATDRAQLAQPADTETSGLFDRLWQGLTAFGQ